MTGSLDTSFASRICLRYMFAQKSDLYPVEVEVAVLDSPSLTVLVVSVDVKQYCKKKKKRFVTYHSPGRIKTQTTAPKRPRKRQSKGTK